MKIARSDCHPFVIVRIEDDGRIHLVQQYLQSRYWEFPQGAWEQKPGADPADWARGELQEETRLIAASMVQAGHLFEAYDYSNQGYHATPPQLYDAVTPPSITRSKTSSRRSFRSARWNA